MRPGESLKSKKRGADGEDIFPADFAELGGGPDGNVKCGARAALNELAAQSAAPAKTVTETLLLKTLDTKRVSSPREVRCDGNRYAA